MLYFSGEPLDGATDESNYAVEELEINLYPVETLATPSGGSDNSLLKETFSSNGPELNDYNKEEEVEINLYSLEPEESHTETIGKRTPDVIPKKRIAKSREEIIQDDFESGYSERAIDIKGLEEDRHHNKRKLAQTREELLNNQNVDVYEEEFVTLENEIIIAEEKQQPKVKLAKSRDDILREQEIDSENFAEEELTFQNDLVYESNNLNTEQISPPKEFAKNTEVTFSDQAGLSDDEVVIITNEVLTENNESTNANVPEPEICEQKESLKKKIASHFENIIQGVRKDSVDREDEDVSDNTGYNEIKMEVPSNVTVPQTHEASATTGDNDTETDDKFSDYKQYEFGKVRLANRRKIKGEKDANKDHHPVDNTKSTTPVEGPKTGKEIADQVQFSYRQHFVIPDYDDEEEISEYRMVLGDNLSDKEKVLKPEELPVKEDDFSPSNKEKLPKNNSATEARKYNSRHESVDSYLNLGDIEVGGNKEEFDLTLEPHDSSFEKSDKTEGKSKKKGWFPWTQEKHAIAVDVGKDIPKDDKEPVVLSKTERIPEGSDVKLEKKPLKKSWFTGKRSLSKDSSPPDVKNTPSKSLMKSDGGIADALRKNSDIVFKATLSPFRRVWSPEERKAEMVDEPSMKRQMIASIDEEEEVDPTGYSNRSRMFSPKRNSLPRSSNEMSLADEFNESRSNDGDLVITEDIVSPINTQPRQESKPVSEKNKEAVRLEGLKALSELLSTDDVENLDDDEIVKESEVNEENVKVVHSKLRHDPNTISFDHLEEAVLPEHLDEARNDVKRSESTDTVTLTDVEREFENLREMLPMPNEMRRDVKPQFMHNEEILVNGESSDDDDVSGAKYSLKDCASSASSKSHSLNSSFDTDNYEQTVVVDLPRLSFDDPEEQGRNAPESKTIQVFDVKSPVASPVIIKRAKKLPSSEQFDSVLDKFFDNPNFEDEDRNGNPEQFCNQFENPNFVMDENERDGDGQSSEGTLNGSLSDLTELDDNTYPPITEKSGSSSIDSKRKKNSDSSSKRGVNKPPDLRKKNDTLSSSSSDVFYTPDATQSDNYRIKDDSLHSIESIQKSASDRDDKCVGTDLDTSGYSLASSSGTTSHYSSIQAELTGSSPVEYSQRMVVSKLSMEPQVMRSVPVNDIAEVVLIIDNGEIKEIRNVDNASPQEPHQSSSLGKYESYEVSPHFERFNDNRKQYTDYDYSSFRTSTPPFGETVETRPGRFSRDSGYHSNYTSMSDGGLPTTERYTPQMSSINLKVSPTQQGASHIPVIRDHTVRSKVRTVMFIY